MSKGQVTQALEKTRDFLAASSLDPGVLRGERPKKAIALINPHQQDVQDYLATAFRAPSRENDPLLLFSRFENTKVRLVGDVVKTRGRITYREGKRGAVEVTTDVTYVYPSVRAAAGSDEVARTIVRREVVMSWDDPAKIVIDPGTFSSSPTRWTPPTVAATPSPATSPPSSAQSARRRPRETARRSTRTTGAPRWKRACGRPTVRGAGLPHGRDRQSREIPR